MTLTGLHLLPSLMELAHSDCLPRQMGQLFMMGFDGTVVNDQIKSLIEDYHVGSILLTAKNLKCASNINNHTVRPID
jgi:hypothetical protein